MRTDEKAVGVLQSGGGEKWEYEGHPGCRMVLSSQEIRTLLSWGTRVHLGQTRQNSAVSYTGTTVGVYELGWLVQNNSGKRTQTESLTPG